MAAAFLYIFYYIYFNNSNVVLWKKKMFIKFDILQDHIAINKGLGT